VIARDRVIKKLRGIDPCSKGKIYRGFARIGENLTADELMTSRSAVLMETPLKGLFELKRVVCSDEHCLCGEHFSRGEKRAWNRNS
jgi:hypothetical protein